MEGAQGGDDEGLTRRTKGAKGKGERDEVITAKFDQGRGESPFEGDRGSAVVGPRVLRRL